MWGDTCRKHWNLQIHVPASASLQSGFPRDYGASPVAQPDQVDPWFYVDNETAASTGYEVLGYYKLGRTDHEAALVRRIHGDHTSIFTGSPGLPVQLWTALARGAGVHMYVDNQYCAQTLVSWQVADVVEVHGSQLMVHASAACSGDVAMPRTISLPLAAAFVYDEANATVCSACRQFATPPMFAGEVHLYNIRQSSL